jgi:hypothetical protein
MLNLLNKASPVAGSMVGTILVQEDSDQPSDSVSEGDPAESVTAIGRSRS